MNKKLNSCLFMGCAFLSAPVFALSVTETNDGSVLAGEILGSGITITNVSYTGSDVSSGLFTDGVSSGLSMENGILLTSGSASLAVGPNSGDGTSHINDLSGDDDLNSLIPGYNTQDATILEFDFVSDGGDLFFNYQFASEEYNEFVNSSFNDVFGFFLDGENIALVPGSSDAVSINNVNNASNAELFNDNDPSDLDPIPYDIEYDGFTDMFTATALGLSAGTHHIKLAIADAGDYVLDSGVFIESGSFSDTAPVPDISPVPEPSTILLLGAGIFGLGFSRKARS
jgi:hypothetical protein